MADKLNAIIGAVFTFLIFAGCVAQLVHNIMVQGLAEVILVFAGLSIMFGHLFWCDMRDLLRKGTNNS